MLRSVNMFIKQTWNEVKYVVTDDADDYRVTACSLPPISPRNSNHSAAGQSTEHYRRITEDESASDRLGADGALHDKRQNGNAALLQGPGGSGAPAKLAPIGQLEPLMNSG